MVVASGTPWTLDYERIAAILRKVDYSGYISLEFEGKAHADEEFPRVLRLLERLLGLARFSGY